MDGFLAAYEKRNIAGRTEIVLMIAKNATLKQPDIKQKLPLQIRWVAMKIIVNTAPEGVVVLIWVFLMN